MGSPQWPGRDDRRSRRRLVVVTGGADGGRWQRLVILGLLLALLIVGGVAAIIRASSAPHHPAAAPARPSASVPATLPFGLVGGGGVRPRHAVGKLAIAGSVGQVLFAENGTVLDRYAQAVIDNAALALRAHHTVFVTVTGYTDAIGSTPANQRLSLRRANVVARALRQRLAGAAIRYRTEARGESAPVASNSTAAGRQLNRRVLITAGSQ